MLKLLAFLWTGCWHKWKILHERHVYEAGKSKSNSYPVYTRYELQCERCGTIKGKNA